GPAFAPVDGQADEGVDERDGVGPTVGRRPRDRHDVGDVRRQLRHQWQGADLPAALDDTASDVGVGGEVDAAGHVGTGQVQFQAGKALRLADHGGHLDEVVLGLAGDVGDDGRRDRPQVGQVVGQEV